MTLRPLYAVLIACLLTALALGIPYAGGFRAAYAGPHAFKAWTATIAAVLFLIAFRRTRPSGD